MRTIVTDTLVPMHKAISIHCDAYSSFVSKSTIIGSDSGLSPGRRQAIIWTNAGILLIGPLGTNFSENLIEIYITVSFKRYLKLSSGSWRPFCLGLYVLRDENSCYQTACVMYMVPYTEGSNYYPIIQLLSIYNLIWT